MPWDSSSAQGSEMSPMVKDEPQCSNKSYIYILHLLIKLT